MANTYTQLYIHFIFAVKSNKCLIQKKWSNELQKYITGISHNLKCKTLSINNVADHIHLFISKHPTISESEYVQKIKNNSARWINKSNFLINDFSWQSGYGAFTYSRSQINNVCKYISNQQEHHRKYTFHEEYISFLEKFSIDYNESYLFDFFDDADEMW